MSEPMYLTFDLGTTALKTALVDARGRIRGLHTREYTYQTPQPDWAEMPAEEYLAAAAQGARAVIRESGCGPDAVSAIGFSSQGETFVALDGAGKPLAPAIVWVDQRALGIADEWEADGLTREAYRRIAGYAWLPCELSAFKIGWLRRHAPEVHRAARFLCLPDWVAFWLTGEAATDYTIALMSGLFDLGAQDWSPEMLRRAGVAREQLPRVHTPGTVMGTLRPAAAAELYLRPGTPVCVGCNDQLAGAIGAGNTAPGVVTETTGTALAVVSTTRDIVDDDRVCVGRHPVPDLFYALSYANTSAIVLRWFRDLVAPGEAYETLTVEAGLVAPGCDGLTVLPHFCGTAPPALDPTARGAIAGLSLGHGRAHIARAIMEACACELRECLEPLLDHGMEVRSVRSLGGAARSDLWLQMKADLLGVPVERPECTDAASVGAAALAATGVGHFASVHEAAQAWYRPGCQIRPDPERSATYEEIYCRYLDLARRVYGR